MVPSKPDKANQFPFYYEQYNATAYILKSFNGLNWISYNSNYYNQLQQALIDLNLQFVRRFNPSQPLPPPPPPKPFINLNLSRPDILESVVLNLNNLLPQIKNQSGLDFMPVNGQDVRYASEQNNAPDNLIHSVGVKLTLKVVRFGARPEVYSAWVEYRHYGSAPFHPKPKLIYFWSYRAPVKPATKNPVPVTKKA